MGDDGTASGAEGPDEVTRRFARLHARLDAQAEVIEAQAATMAALQQRLDRIDSADVPDDRDGPPPATPLERAVLAEPTSRRHLMTKGAAAAASAAIAGTVLGVANASPAAAASGTFDGDPAVLAVGTPGGTGVQGTTSGNAGVHGTAVTGDGVRGVSQSGFGTKGISPNGVGVGGESSDPNSVAVKGENAATTGPAIAVLAVSGSTQASVIKAEATATTGRTNAVAAYSASDAGWAVLGHATAVDGPATGVRGLSDSPTGIGVWGSGALGVVADGSLAQLKLVGSLPPPLSGNGLRSEGEVVFDNHRDLWLCVDSDDPISGLPTWTRLGGKSTVGTLAVLDSTARIYDSRPGTQPPTGMKTKFQSGFVRALAATGNSSGVPSSARAVMISATATNTNPGGFFSFYKTGIAFPGNSSLNWGLVNSTVAVTTVVACGADATFNARMEGAGGADLVVDVIGYYL
jgi:hypothetical protein